MDVKEASRVRWMHRRLREESGPSVTSYEPKTDLRPQRGRGWTW